MIYIVLVFVYVYTGNTYMSARGPIDNPQLFETVQECEAQQKLDEIELTPAMSSKKFDRFFWQCMTADSYLESIRKK